MRISHIFHILWIFCDSVCILHTFHVTRISCPCASCTGFIFCEFLAIMHLAQVSYFFDFPAFAHLAQVLYFANFLRLGILHSFHIFVNILPVRIFHVFYNLWISWECASYRGFLFCEFPAIVHLAQVSYYANFLPICASCTGFYILWISCVLASCTHFYILWISCDCASCTSFILCEFLAYAHLAQVSYFVNLLSMRILHRFYILIITVIVHLAQVSYFMNFLPMHFLHRFYILWISCNCAACKSYIFFVNFLPLDILHRFHILWISRDFASWTSLYFHEFPAYAHLE